MVTACLRLIFPLDFSWRHPPGGAAKKTAGVTDTSSMSPRYEADRNQELQEGSFALITSDTYFIVGSD